MEKQETQIQPSGQPAQEKNNNLKYFFFSVATIAVFFLIGYFVFTKIGAREKDAVVAEKRAVEEDLSGFNSLLLDAKAVFVWDIVEKKAIYSKNEEAQMPLASLSKIMTVLIASEYLKNNSAEFTNKKETGKWSLKNLIDFTLVTSSNDGASLLASAIEAFDKNFENEDIFTDKMNKKAKELGLKQTYFINETGLDIDEQEQSGSYGSARDIAMLLNYTIKNNPEIMEATSYDNIKLQTVDGKMHMVKNTNEAINKIPWILASKTGYTKLAGGNLVVAFDVGPARPIIISVMGSTKDGRFEDMEKLVETAIKHIAKDN